MKILPIILITIYIISTVSGDHHHHHHSEKCIGYNKKCSSHRDCCSGVCYYSYLWLHKYCRERNDFWFVIKTVIRLIAHGEDMERCTYKHTLPSNETTISAFGKLEVTADHSKYPANTKLEVMYNYKYLEVEVNDIGLKYNDSTLELSPKAAELLDIKNGDIVPCKIKVPHVEKVFIEKVLSYCYPILFVYLFITLIG